MHFLELVQMDFCDIQTIKAVFVLANSYNLNDPGQCEQSYGKFNDVSETFSKKSHVKLPKHFLGGI